MALSIDLILVFWYPFAPRSSRSPIAITLSVLLGSILAALIAAPVSYLVLNVAVYVTAVLICGYIGIAIFSIFYAMFKSCSSSVSSDASSMIFRRHVLSTVVFIATNIYTWLNLLYIFDTDYMRV